MSSEAFFKVTTCSVHLSDTFHSVKWDPHGYHQLSCRKVDIWYHFCARMLNLETRIELQKKPDKGETFYSNFISNQIFYERKKLTTFPSWYHKGILLFLYFCIPRVLPTGLLPPPFLETLPTENNYKLLSFGGKKIKSQVTLLAITTGASSMIFWCRLWIEQSLPKMDIAVPSSSAKSWTSKCLAFAASFIIKTGEPGTSDKTCPNFEGK